MQQITWVRPRCTSYVHLFTPWHCLPENFLIRSGSRSSRRTRRTMYSYSLSLPWASVFHFCAYLFFFDNYILSLIPPSLCCWFMSQIYIYIYIYTHTHTYIYIFLIPMLCHRLSSRVEPILHSRRLQFRKGGRHESNTCNLSLQAFISESHSVAQSCPILCDPMDCCPPGSSVHGDSPGKHTGVGCHALLQGIFPIQG